MISKMTEDQLATSLVHLLDIDDNSSEGAVIFLNGPWGSGKTFFWKHYVSTKLKGVRPISLSLFGVNSVSDLRTKIASKIILGENADSKIVKAAKAIYGSAIAPFLKKISGVDIKIDVLEFYEARQIVCFDDLERLSSDASIEEILGFINYLAEHKFYKCLVILNHSEMKDPHRSAFDRLREKLSLRSFTLPFDLDFRVDSFIKHFNANEAKKISELEEKNLKEIIIATETNNLRTIRFILECFFQIRRSVKREIPELAIKFLVALIHNESNGNIKDLSFYTFNPSEFFYNEYLRKNKDGTVDPPNPQVKFHAKYFGENSRYNSYPSIFELVRNGYFNSEQGYMEFFPVETELSAGDKLEIEIKDLYMFFMNDDQLLSLMNKILDAFKNNPELSFKNIFALVRVLSSIIRLLELPTPTELPEGFENAARKAVTQVEILVGYSNDFTHPGIELHKIFGDCIEKLCKEESIKREQEAIRDAISSLSLEAIASTFIGKIRQLEEIMTRGYFQEIFDSKGFTTSELYHLLVKIISDLQLQSTNNEKIKTELEMANEFLISRFNETQEKMQRLRTYRLIELCKLKLPDNPPKSVKKIISN